MSDATLQARMTRLRQIIADSVPVEPPKAHDEADAWRRYQQFAANDPLPAHDTSQRARWTRNINRIAGSYGWISELQRLLDNYEASSLSALNDEQVDVIHRRFVTLESCYREGCDLPDSPHAS